MLRINLSQHYFQQYICPGPRQLSEDKNDVQYSYLKNVGLIWKQDAIAGFMKTFR